MKKFLHVHPDFVIGALALIFVSALVTFYFWATGDIFTQIDRALAPPSAQTVSGFDLSGASKLDYRGSASTSTFSGPK